MDRMNYNLDDVQYQNENLDIGYVNYPSIREQILGRLPKILIYASFAVISIFYSCLAATSTPVLFTAGIIIASVFILRSIAELCRIFNNKSNGYVNEEEQIVSRNKSDKQHWIDFCALLMLGLSLIALGITFMVAPAFLGIFMHVHTVFKIGLSILGVFFVGKDISCLNSKLFRKRAGLIIKNLPDVLLYASGFALGIFSLVLTGGLAPVPIILTTVVFALRTIASICNIFQQKSQTARNLAIKFEAISLAMIGCALIISGILFSPAVAALIGTSTLFVKMTLLITGFLFALSAAAKFWVGSKLKELEEVNISIPSVLDNQPLSIITPLHKSKLKSRVYQKQQKLSLKSAAPIPGELQAPLNEEENVVGCFHFLCK